MNNFRMVTTQPPLWQIQARAESERRRRQQGGAMSAVATKERESCLALAAEVGCDPGQIERFLRAGYFPQFKQMIFHTAARLADEPGGPDRVAMGGTRGTAKSHAIIAQVGMDDCQRFPGLKVLYLRNIGKAAAEQFEDLIAKLFSLVPHAYKNSRGLLNFPNSSRIILGGFKDESEIDNYLGIEYDLIVIEDGTTLSASKRTAIRGSLRTSKPGWRPRLYESANPGGIGHADFKQTYVDPWLKRQEDDTRFIHTVMGDNVYIDPGYARYLDSLTGWLRRAWRDGDFSIAAGQFFTAFDPELHLFDYSTFTRQADWPVWASMDYGFAHWNMVHLFTQDGDGNRYVMDEYAMRRALIPTIADGIKAMLARNGLTLAHLRHFVAGTDVFATKLARKADEPQTIAEEYAGYGINFEPAQTDRISGAAKILTYLGNPEQELPARLFISTRCHKLIETLPSMQHDPRRMEDVLKVDCNSETGEGGDDPYDSFRYGLQVEFSKSTGLVVQRRTKGWQPR